MFELILIKKKIPTHEREQSYAMSYYQPNRRIRDTQGGVWKVYGVK